MSKLHCTISCRSPSPHLEQIHTGFQILRERGLIEYSVVLSGGDTDSASAPQHLLSAFDSHLLVRLSTAFGHTSSLHFDCHDAVEIDAQHLRGCDLYFKRSYSRAYLEVHHPAHGHRVRPLGLNFQLLPSTISFGALRRRIALSRTLREKISACAAILDTKNRLSFHPRVRQMQSWPAADREPKALFMVAAYDPHDNPDRPPEKVEERIRNNEFRARCIEALRAEFGPRFYGGFARNQFTNSRYPNLQVDNPQTVQKRNYIRLLHDFPICIATTGLHGSIGWKLAEYVAFSKAVVSEQLDFEVPGSFQADRNYLQFSSPAECVQAVSRLMTDQSLRLEIMRNNFTYYHHFVRPDMLVLNALSQAVSALPR